MYIPGSFYQRCPVLHLAGMSMPLKSTAPHNRLSDTALEASHVVFQFTNKCCLFFENLPAALQLLLIALNVREILLQEF